MYMALKKYPKYKAIDGVDNEKYLLVKEFAYYINVLNW